MSLFSVLFVIFLVLKLLHIVAWSWWWVTAPLWIPACFGAGYMLMVTSGVITAHAIGKTKTRKR
ncbi:hypothetical protein [Nocardia jiangxiensis]|uniref:hypothetical protein n=1 Tax=Nocardia jiangxiensis TaxID=282685 RepID=UPI00059480B2|nr:hypothetical protein [Nocardia jiangxiensis]